MPLWLALLFAAGHAMSCSSTRSQPPDGEPTAAQVGDALRRGDHDAAASTAQQLLKRSPEDPQTWRLVADALLRTGRVERAAELYDQFAEERPETVPFLWQRGIALTLSGRYQDAARQFESHREVNPNDVENAAWHFLALAKATTVREAREKLLPAPGDPRPPMKEVLQFLKDGNAEPVTDRIEQLPEETPARRSAAFYGYLYLGMVADAEGDTMQALSLVTRSTEYTGNNYMGDVARAYAGILKRQSDQ